MNEGYKLSVTILIRYIWLHIDVIITNYFVKIHLDCFFVVVVLTNTSLFTFSVTHRASNTIAN